ncbi:hypothetical protein [uncultured Mycobacterium sp.]|uniref:hypothetical protein n=1 Tax=uncultured Mycobacterium sp. TaxID=171292 RepID=UPI0035CC0C86
MDSPDDPGAADMADVRNEITTAAAEVGALARECAELAARADPIAPSSDKEGVHGHIRASVAAIARAVDHLADMSITEADAHPPR